MSEASYTEEQLFELFGTTPTSMRWHPIETAPYDVEMIIYDPNQIIHKIAVAQRWSEYPDFFSEDYRGFMVQGVGVRDEDGNMTIDYLKYEPTHWMPLPARPK